MTPSDAPPWGDQIVRLEAFLAAAGSSPCGPGGTWHEYAIGHVRHDHERMIPGGGSPFRGEAMLGIGVLIAVVGGIAMLWK